jgi:ABC-type transport system involved in multi-copper enzyme maturation permease subunit
MRATFALFIRSLREDTRAKLPVLLRTTLVGLILLAVWSSQLSFSYSPAPGRQLLMMVMMINVCFLMLAALSIFPSAISEEKEDGTLPLLRMTNLSVISILFGKSMTRLFAALILLAAQIPFTLLSVTLGGVRFEQVMECYLALIVTALFLCNMALFFSVVVKTGLRACIYVTLFGFAFYLVIPVIFSAYRWHMTQITTSFWGEWGMWFTSIVSSMNPFFMIAAIIQGSFMPFSMGGFWVANLVGSSIFFALSWLLFDRFCTREADSSGARGNIMGRIFGWKSRRRRPSPRWALIWKDFQFFIGGRFGILMRIFCVFVSVVASYIFCRYVAQPYRYPSMSDDKFSNDVLEYTGRFCIGVGVVFAAVELLLASSRLYGAERNRLTLSSIVGLPWSLFRITWQKMAACIPAFIPWAVLIYTGLVLLDWNPLYELLVGFSHFDLNRDADALAALICFTMQGILGLALCVWFSLRIKFGAIPAAAVIMVVYNIAYFVVFATLGHSHTSETAAFLFNAFITTFALLFVIVRIFRRIETAASED